MSVPTLDLLKFLPFRLNRLAAEVSADLSDEYRDRYGLDIPEWRVMATLGFRNAACTAQYIAYCTRTHKSTISRAVNQMQERQLIERVENQSDRREWALQLTKKGRAIYLDLIPRLKKREQKLLACLTVDERVQLSALLGKIETSLDLVQSPQAAKALEDVY